MNLVNNNGSSSNIINKYNSNDEELILLTSVENGANVRASSVLQKNTKLYGPMNMLDTESSSSWNSEGINSNNNNSSRQQQHWLVVNFARVTPRDDDNDNNDAVGVVPLRLDLQFQAGFVATECRVQLQQKSDNTWIDVDKDDLLDVQDVHDVQTFELNMRSSSTTTASYKAMKLTMSNFTDFYGRVIIYQLQVWGKKITINNETTE